MAHPMLDAGRYLRKAGREGPVCFQEGVSRDDLAIQAHVVNDVRVILVPCHCTRCPATWVETHRLVGVDSSAEEAIATATRTCG
jgi:hypothetical protein